MQGRRCSARSGGQQTHHPTDGKPITAVWKSTKPRTTPVGQMGTGQLKALVADLSSDRVLKTAIAKTTELSVGPRTHASNLREHTQSATGFADCCRWRSGNLSLTSCWNSRLTKNIAAGGEIMPERSRGSAIGAYRFCCGEAVRQRTVNRYYRVYRGPGRSLRLKKRKHCARAGAPLRQQTAANQECRQAIRPRLTGCGSNDPGAECGADAFTREYWRWK